ncbi:hypothetical protein LCGC14_0739330 [marine sediment metagenome]|uniref:Ribbon-helix-helix protein CopG domain-containing protein n=1 Tax=marine sediment metagenome TaxID=412755 RepID=A0A0F9SS22_9ZZZZ
MVLEKVVKPKEITFRLPPSMWEAFTRAFPAQGDKSRFLRKAVGVGIRFKGREREVVKELIRVMIGEEEKEEENDDR